MQLLCNQDNPLQPFYRRIALPAWIVRKSRTVAAEAALTGTARALPAVANLVLSATPLLSLLLSGTSVGPGPR